MIKIYSEPIYKQIGKDIVTIPNKARPNVDTFVPEVTEAFTKNSTEQFSNLKKRASQLSAELQIPFDDAIKRLYQNGERFIDLIV